MLGEADRRFMARAVELARRGLWTTTPNPRVGCVLVRDGEIVAEGWHRRAGEPHAEVVALAAAGVAARGATAYVTLEPCAHHGRTGPCADALVRAGVARVIAAMEDPNPLVAGGGLARLRAAGIDVRCGLLEAEARELNPGFVSRMSRGLPWVRLKVAASLDGRTALHDGRSQWITGAAARADGHAWRARACAILTGIGTVRDDDPALSVRDVEGHPDAPPPGDGPLRQPLRVVVDSRLEIDPGARLVRAGGLLVVHALDDAMLAVGPLAEKARLLADHGVELLRIAPVPAPQAGVPTADDHPGTGGVSGAGKPGKVDLGVLLRALAERGVNELHVESGAGLNGSLVREGRVDELLVYLAPSLIGDARAMFDLAAPGSLDDARRLAFHSVDRVGDDLRIVARFLRS